jgi:hypothetical protein
MVQPFRPCPARGLAKNHAVRTSQDSDAVTRNTAHASRRFAACYPARTIRFPEGPAVNRSNMLYLIIGYQDRHQPEGLHINVGPGGLSIQGK